MSEGRKNQNLLEGMPPLDAPDDFFNEEEEEESIPCTPMTEKNPFYNKIAIPSLEYSGELAVALLLLKWVPRFANFTVIRTDDPEIIKECGMKINQTTTFEPEKLVFSRQTKMHFEGFPSTIGIAGLIYYMFGREALKNHYKIEEFEDKADERFMFLKIYKCLIEPLDLKAECDISRLANELDPADDPDPFVKQDAIESLMELIEEQITQRQRWILKTMLPDRAFIRKAMDDRKKTLSSGEILYLSHFVPIFLHKDIIDPDETKKQTTKFIVMGRVTNDAIVHTFSWRQNFKRLNHRGKSGDQLTGLLQNITGTGWVHPNGALAEWNSMQNALEFSKQMLKAPEKA